MPARRLLSLALALSLLAPSTALAAAPMSGGAFEQKISVSIVNQPLRDAIRLVAQKGRLNVVVEESLGERVSVNFNDVRLADALQALFAMGGVQAVWQGNAMAVMGARKVVERGLLSGSARVFSLRYASATRVAALLNASVLSKPYAGGAASDFAKADARANAVVVTGGPGELDAAEKLVKSLDTPPSRRIFRLSHANAVQVASFLNATLFNTGGKGENAENLRVEAESLSEGMGAAGLSTGVQLSGSQNAIRTSSLASQNLAIEAKQPIAVPDSRSNSVLVLASPEAIAQAAEFIAQLDSKLSQVSIEVEVVEVDATDALDLNASLTGAKDAYGSTFDTGSQGGWSLVFDPASPSAGSFKARLSALVQDKRAKLLAHPTILATDNTEAQINIVDEVIKGTRLTTQAVNVGGQNLLMSEPIYGVAGVTLNILPRIGADGTVSLRLHPTISSVRETLKDAANNPISLLSRRELVAQQIVVPNGKSLSLGGLTQTQELTNRNKIPLLGDIPFLGFFFGGTSSQKRQTELMIVVTPRIVE